MQDSRFDRPLTIEQANAVFDLLVEHCQASEWLRDEFVFHQTDRYCDEFRFQGALGFGGKFYRRSDRIGSVGCYVEDDNPARLRMITEVNRRLRDFNA